MTTKRFNIVDLLETLAISDNDECKCYQNDNDDFMSLCNLLNDLHDENKQLKTQLDYIQNLISEHIKHQKTELGQKALKEIIQDYNKWLLEPQWR